MTQAQTTRTKLYPMPRADVPVEETVAYREMKKPLLTVIWKAPEPGAGPSRTLSAPNSPAQMFTLG